MTDEPTHPNEEERKLLTPEEIRREGVREVLSLSAEKDAEELDYLDEDTVPI